MSSIKLNDNSRNSLSIVDLPFGLTADLVRRCYGTTLGRKDIADQLPFARAEDTLPAVLSQDEVLRLLKAESNLKMRTAYTAIYAASLRVSEVVALTIKDIDSTRKVIHIRQAKGRKDRYVMLSEQLLIILRDYWRRTHPPHWLFPGPDRSRPVTTRSVQRAFRNAADVCQRLMTVPGVGPVVALTHRVTVDVPARFRNSKAVGAVFGLTPSKFQSGESERTGRISRCGDDMMRVILYEAAQVMLFRSANHGWGDEDCTTSWDENGDRSPGTTAGRDHAPHMG